MPTVFKPTMNCVPIGLAGQVRNVGYAFVAACERNEVDLAHIFIKLGATNLEDGMYAACAAGHITMIDALAHELLKRSDADRFQTSHGWDEFLETACKHGRCQAAERLMALGATKVDIGLAGACEWGHMNCAQLMIACGARNWNHAHGAACSNNMSRTMRFMRDCGATSCPCGWPMAAHEAAEPSHV